MQTPPIWSNWQKQTNYNLPDPQSATNTISTAWNMIMSESFLLSFWGLYQVQSQSESLKASLPLLLFALPSYLSISAGLLHNMAYLYETQQGISLTCSKSEYQMHFCHSSGERKDVYRLQALGQSEDLLVENLNTNLVKEVSNKQVALFVQVRGVKFWQKHGNCHWDLHPGDVLLCCSVPQLVNHWGSVPKNTLNRPKLTKITVQW